MNSTPINALNRNEEQDPNTREMVENIVNEIDGGANGLAPGDPRGGMYHPQQQQFEGMHGDPRGMDGGDEMYGDFQGGGMEYGPPQGGQGYYGGPPQNQGFGQGPPQGYYGGQGPSKGVPEAGGFMSSFGGMGGGSFTDRIVGMLKEPLIVAVLFFVLSNGTVASMIESYIPYGYGLMFGLIVRSLVAGALFFVTKTFVLH